MVSIDNLGSLTWDFQRTHYWTSKMQDMAETCQKAIFSKTKQFRAMVSIDDL